MSYNIALYVKVENTGIYFQVSEPVYSHPTYTLGTMFRACMDWNYSQSEKNEDGENVPKYYPCELALDKVEHGIRELRTNAKAYMKYNSPNVWGDIPTAVKALESLRECILETAEGIPLKNLYMAW